MIYIGVDPGVNGAMARIHISEDSDTFIYTVPFTNIQDMLKSLCVDTDECFATIELVHALHNSAAKSTFEFGKNLGEWIGLMTGLGIPYQLVPPATWQKVMMPGKPRRPPKQQPYEVGSGGPVPNREKQLAEHRRKVKAHAYSVARGLWPDHDFKRTARCRGPHDGCVDAALLAEYGRRMRRED